MSLLIWHFGKLVPHTAHYQHRFSPCVQPPSVSKVEYTLNLINTATYCVFLMTV
jgi:hypothetical protein